jgi:hypothetical protein
LKIGSFKLHFFAMFRHVIGTTIIAGKFSYPGNWAGISNFNVVPFEKAKDCLKPASQLSLP